LIHGFVWAMPSRRINNFPESRRGLGHVTLTIFGSTVGYPSDSLASCQNSFTAEKRMKFPTKPLNFFHHILSMFSHYLGNIIIQIDCKSC